MMHHLKLEAMIFFVGEASTTWRVDEWILTVVYKRYLFSKKAILDVYIRLQEGKHQAFLGRHDSSRGFDLILKGFYFLHQHKIQL